MALIVLHNLIQNSVGKPLKILTLKDDLLLKIENQKAAFIRVLQVIKKSLDDFQNNECFSFQCPLFGLI